MSTLKEIREENYISRRELSDWSGVSESTLVRIEEGLTRTTKKVADKILQALSEHLGKQYTLQNVEGIKLYNVMRDRKRTKPAA